MVERFQGQKGRRRLVQALSDQELILHNEAVARKLVEVVELEEYKEEQEVYIQGQISKNKLYFILSGKFDLLVHATPITLLESGQSVGEFPILNPSLPYTVRIRAREAGIVGTVLEDQYFSIAEEYPEIWRNMAKMLAERLRATHDVVPVPKDPCVFIGHGHSGLWARIQVFLQNDCRLKVITFESESHVGESIVEVLQRMLGKATFAVLVLTGEDETNQGGKRPRQNVVHEAGLFQGELGFKKAILLVQRGLEQFSNVHGLQYISCEADNIEGTFLELQKALKREKQIS